ncbi:hypothetical protein [Conexibacter sp. CPCC 206217]|uniref:hypothetical protein n=1 Tax=Conexibacter sp. CPCC 206217 TaxID=3064574 RepID=UPI00271CEC61|nr:hypothetical protein [Conexibacter sp. CPCC 206217]MDO8208960.1 hypothetical protein [Conexibacter sp. CPCC 206217]
MTGLLEGRIGGAVRHHVVPITIRTQLEPIWTQVEPPTPDRPYWHETEDGSRRHLLELLGGDPAQAARVQSAHQQVIAELVGAAISAQRDGHDREARRLAMAAARLVEEVVGFWPVTRRGD